MVVIIFPMLNESQYSHVKKLCCIEFPVPLQLIVLKTISKPDSLLILVVSNNALN